MATKTKRIRRIVCWTREKAHALRHELDKLGALSRRRGRIVTTDASKGKLAKAKRRAHHSLHHGRTR